MSKRRVAILGSTGSIGSQALEVIASQPDLCVCALAAGNNWKLLGEQARQFAPEAAALASPDSADALRAERKRSDAPAMDILSGPDAMVELVRKTRPDVLLSGVVGTAGLAPTMAAIECGSDLAIANKETLVMAGEIVMPAARKAGVSLLPVDSEHSAIFQCLQAGTRPEVRRIVITASGGALRDWPAEKVETAGVEDALRHPTWSMGQKITIDSATLLNKALEVVEAHWLFDMPADRIDVVLHAESIIHSYVEFTDGSTIAQMGEPSMTTPIAYALSWPRRFDRDVAPLDLAGLGKLTFATPTGRFERAVRLGHQAIRLGGTAGAVLNAANEAAVEAFLAGRIRFGQIVPLVETVLNLTPPVTEVNLNVLLRADEWARRQVEETIKTGV